MKTLKKIVLIGILIMVSLTTNAQQDAMYTHYMYNTLMVNPGYAGSRDALTITALHRSQWVNFKGAPIVQSVTLHAPLRDQHLGLGLSVLNDKIGSTNKTSVFGDFAYRMNLTKKSKLAFGISAGANVYQANLSALQLDQPIDPVFQTNINNKITPNFGFGVYYSKERFYAGLSVPYLLQNNYSAIKQANGSTLIGTEQRHYFFIAGAVLNLTNDIAFKPTTFIKATPAAPIQADLTASFIIMKKVLVGVMMRTGDAYGGLIGLNATEQLYFGYSFDWSNGLKTGKYNQGSHEIVLRYDFLVFDKRQIHSPRYF
ncbi:MAG: type IX secretion system membrane protein PorP/SprF [Bacteroidota bacterium]|nr:type IX secretion system membrane protein PorP/SprF [Bacteroidota bacterium]